LQTAVALCDGLFGLEPDCLNPEMLVDALLPKPGISWESATKAHPAVPVVRDVAMTLLSKSQRKRDFYVVERAGGADVLLGPAFFNGIRVTIDSSRKVLLLERNR
jgi:hypothetical protein